MELLSHGVYAYPEDLAEALRHRKAGGMVRVLARKFWTRAEVQTGTVASESAKGYNQLNSDIVDAIVCKFSSGFVLFHSLSYLTEWKFIQLCAAFQAGCSSTRRRQV